MSPEKIRQRNTVLECKVFPHERLLYTYVLTLRYEDFGAKEKEHRQGEREGERKKIRKERKKDSQSREKEDRAGKNSIEHTQHTFPDSKELDI